MAIYQILRGTIVCDSCSEVIGHIQSAAAVIQYLDKASIPLPVVPVGDTKR